ncbi:MAG: GntR family transcriptional regulator [Flavobacteriales bacterium]|nr:GntR family transcriptional regulator [Flavobacteriales bacterium]MCB9174163.1 GntR family transcriptional regulator [Flavobacteriales bacterium]
MKEIGHFVELEALKTTPQGIYLITDEQNEILLPNKYIPKWLEIGDKIEVFVYTDSEDRPIATTLIPKVKINEIALLKAVDVTDFGAFFDWGVEKHLLVPFSEQFVKVEKDKSYLIYLYKDDVTNRMVGTTKFSKFLRKNPIELKVGDKVNFIVSGQTDIGYTIVVEQKHLGMIYKNEVFKDIRLGDEFVGYVRNIREDLKIDVSMNSTAIDEIEILSNKIYEKLLKEKGIINISDKSNPDEIYNMFQVSKKAFKRAIGVLYSERKIKINPASIVLVEN